MSLLLLELNRGGDAFILSHNRDFVTLASTAPSPPGSTVEATLRAEARSVTLRVKVRSCKRQDLPDGRSGFRIDGRFVSLSRGDREILLASRDDTDLGSTSETSFPKETQS